MFRTHLIYPCCLQTTEIVKDLRLLRHSGLRRRHLFRCLSSILFTCSLTSLAFPPAPGGSVALRLLALLPGVKPPSLDELLDSFA